jgi:hypothetical protein
MNAFIFISVICIGQQCEFFASTKPITESKCAAIKQDFSALPFKPEITLVASQCMPFNEGIKT